jgi:transposase
LAVERDKARVRAALERVNGLFPILAERAKQKAGNLRARRILVEAAWAYRHPARVGREKQAKVAAAPRRVREIAWKAQTRLCRRFRSLEL